MKIGFVFTNYNNSDYTRVAVQSIINNDYLNETEIIIVDNKSEEYDLTLLKIIKKDFPKIDIIFNDENIGYFKGLNVGIEYLTKKTPDVEIIIIGNNDLVFPSEFINSLKENKSLFDNHAVISPDIITLDGKHQNPHSIKGASKIREIIYDLYYTNYNLALLILYIAKKTERFTDRKDEMSYDKAQIIYQGYGACYIIGPLFFKHFDKLWAPTFLMGEEYFLSEQLAKKHLHIYYEPKIKVDHHDHATISKLPSKEFWKISKQSHKLLRKTNTSN